MRTEFEDYFGKLGLLFGSAALAVLLLKVLCVLYPVLACICVPLEAPLVVVVKNEWQVHALLAVLQGFGLPTVVTLAEKPKRIQKILEEIPYGLVIFRYKSGRYLQENLEQLAQKMVETDVSTPLKPLITIIAVGGFPTRYVERVAGTIYLFGESHTNCGYIELPKIERSFILHWLENGGQRLGLGSQTDESIDIFRFAAAFLIDFFRSNHYEVEAEGLKGALEEILNKIEATWDMLGNPAEYAKAFRDALFEAIDWLPGPIFNRKRVEGVVVEDLHLLIYYDQIYYYLPLIIFERICEPLVGDVGIEQIKGMLADAELLIPGKGGDGRNYFTPKIEIITAIGHKERIRMIRIARNKVDCPGELNFKEIMESRGGDFDD